MLTAGHKVWRVDVVVVGERRVACWVWVGVGHDGLCECAGGGARRCGAARVIADEGKEERDCDDQACECDGLRLSHQQEDDDNEKL